MGRFSRADGVSAGFRYFVSLLDSDFHAFHQAGLRGVLPFQRRRDPFILAAFDEEAVDDDRLPLALPVQSGVRLLIPFEVPRQAKPDDVVAALLEVEPVCAACWVRQQDVDLSGVPSALVLSVLVHGDSKAPVARLKPG